MFEAHWERTCSLEIFFSESFKFHFLSFFTLSKLPQHFSEAAKTEELQDLWTLENFSEPSVALFQDSFVFFEEENASSERVKVVKAKKKQLKMYLKNVQQFIWVWLIYYFSSLHPHAYDISRNILQVNSNSHQEIVSQIHCCCFCFHFETYFEDFFFLLSAHSIVIMKVQFRQDEVAQVKFIWDSNRNEPFAVLFCN